MLVSGIGTKGELILSAYCHATPLAIGLPDAGTQERNLFERSCPRIALVARDSWPMELVLCHKTVYLDGIYWSVFVW